MNTYNNIIRSVLKNDNKIVIFVSYNCPYCIRALHILKYHKIPSNIHDIDKINGGLDKILDKLNEDPKATGFDPNHTTKPVIFENGKFIGGCSELEAKYPS